MKNTLLIIGFLLVLVWAVLEPVEPPQGLDKELTIPSGAYSALSSILESGIYQDGPTTLDLSPVQNITINNGKATLQPPAKVSWRFITTTVTEIRVSKDGSHLLIDIDNSPLDIIIRPETP